MEGQAGGESAAGPATPPCREGLPARPVPRAPEAQACTWQSSIKAGRRTSSTVLQQSGPKMLPLTSPSSHAQYPATSSGLRPAGLFKSQSHHLQPCDPGQVTSPVWASLLVGTETTTSSQPWLRVLAGIKSSRGLACRQLQLNTRGPLLLLSLTGSGKEAEAQSTGEQTGTDPKSPLAPGAGPRGPTQFRCLSPPLPPAADSGPKTAPRQCLRGGCPGSTLRPVSLVSVPAGGRERGAARWVWAGVPAAWRTAASRGRGGPRQALRGRREPAGRWPPAPSR